MQANQKPDSKGPACGTHPSQRPRPSASSQEDGKSGVTTKVGKRRSIKTPQVSRCFDLVSCFHGIKAVRNLTIFYLDSIDPRDKRVADLLLGSGSDKKSVFELWKSPQNTVYEVVESANGMIVRLVNYKLHSETQYAISFWLTNIWFRGGKLHRENGPAIIDSWSSQYARNGIKGDIETYSGTNPWLEEKRARPVVAGVGCGNWNDPAAGWPFSEKVKGAIFVMIQARGRLSPLRPHY